MLTISLPLRFCLWHSSSVALRNRLARGREETQPTIVLSLQGKLSYNIGAHLKQAQYSPLDSHGQRTLPRDTKHSGRTVCIRLSPAPFKMHLDAALGNWPEGEGEDMLNSMRRL